MDRSVAKSTSSNHLCYRKFKLDFTTSRVSVTINIREKEQKIVQNTRKYSGLDYGGSLIVDSRNFSMCKTFILQNVGIDIPFAINVDTHCCLRLIA